MKGGTKKATKRLHFAGVLERVRKPAQPNENPMKRWSNDERRIWTEAKRQYSDDLSREITKEIERDLQSHFPKAYSGQGVGTGAASAHGVKSIDVAFNIEGLFLGLGISVKTVGLPRTIVATPTTSNGLQRNGRPRRCSTIDICPSRSSSEYSFSPPMQPLIDRKHRR